MKNNLEKWNYYKSIIDNKTNEFINSILEGKVIPEKFYKITYANNIIEYEIIGSEYSHHKHKGKTYFNGKKPTTEDVKEIETYCLSEIPFTIENIWFKYSQYYSDSNLKSTSSINFDDLINKKEIFYSIEETKIELEKAKAQNEELRLFRENNKRDNNFSYAGYKFLGWRNGWSDNPVEYTNCRSNNHRLIEFSKNSRGSENVVDCVICKIYWKYDSSD